MTPACTDQPDLFFPETPDGVREPRSGPAIEEAKRVCRDCPLRTGCLKIGLFEPYGIWGGLTAPERRALAATVPLRRRREVSAAVDWVLVQRLIAGIRCEVPADMLDETIRALKAAGMRADWIVSAVKVPFRHVRDVLGLAA